MRPVVLLLGALVLLAGGAWWFLGGAPEPGPEPLLPETATRREVPDPTAPSAASRATTPEARVEGPAPDPARAMRWGETRLVLPEGTGVVTGQDLLAAIEAAGVLAVKADEADLAALRTARFPDVPRTAEMHHLMIEPLLRDAGFDAVVSYPTLRLRKRPPERDPPR